MTTNRKNEIHFSFIRIIIEPIDETIFSAFATHLAVNQTNVVLYNFRLELNTIKSQTLKFLVKQINVWFLRPTIKLWINGVELNGILGQTHCTFANDIKLNETFNHR